MDMAYHSSIATILPSQPWPRLRPTSPAFNLPFAYQNLGGESFLTFTTSAPSFVWALSEDIGVIRHLQAICHSMVAMDDHERWIFKAFTTLIAGTAEIQQVCHGSPSVTYE